MIFHKIISFLAINKLRLSTYICTPSGIPKLKLWLSLLIPKLFSYSLIDKVKAQITKIYVNNIVDKPWIGLG